ncbi:transcription initiation factor TFIID subunit 3-like isoform X1 [Varroa jacobsoni]|uniref:transcription initiation factor TFIID subunit 3-like isoform X1 n=1 Tax=Varroa jacobsoni TaxID=62625 RepID=UPI000BF60FDA|nr:transcription initiation factor TFIID subunit 3-like isoform X1 [Varroa jacobsoni]
MSREFSTALLGKVVGHICLNVGWNNIQQSSLSILVDILQRYLIELGKCAHAFTNGAGRTETNTEDVFLAFSDFGITESDLLDYLLNVDSLPFPSKLPRFPVQQPAQLCFPKIEDPQRPEWIPSYFPATRPESELTSAAPSNGTGPNGQLTAAVPAIEYETPEHQPQVAPTSPQVENGTKRPEDGSVKVSSSKKVKVLAEEGTPMREVIFIQMTPSGFLSAIRDGRLPDACHPSKLLLDPRSSEHENSSDDEPSPDPLKQTTGAAAGNAKAAGKKRKRGGKTAAEAKADKFFDEKIVSNTNNSNTNSNIVNNNNNNNNNNTDNSNNDNNNKDSDKVNTSGSLITSIKLDKQAGTIKEKKTKDKDKSKDKEKVKMGKLSKLAKVKESKDKAAKLLLLKTKKGKKRKNPTGGRPPKPAKVARLSSPSKGDGTKRRLPMITTKLPRPDSVKLDADEADSSRKKKVDACTNNDIHSDNDSQSPVKLKVNDDLVTTTQVPQPPVKLKVTKAERLEKKERLLKIKNKKGRRELKIKNSPDTKEAAKVVKEPPSTKKELLLSIDDAISTVIAEARRNVNDRSLADERGRKKLVVKDVFLSDSEPELRRDPSPHSDDDIEVIDHPKTPDLPPTSSGDNVFVPTEIQKDTGDDLQDFNSPDSEKRLLKKKKVSPLEELARQMPLRMESEPMGGVEDSNSRLLTPSVTITPVPLTPLNAAPPPTPTLPLPTPTLTVKTLAERKGLPPLEIDPDKKKRKEKRKEKKEKKTGGKKKEVPKLTLKLLSSAASLSEPLFEPTPLVAAPAIVPPKKSGATTGNNKTPPKGKGKNSLLRKMVTEVGSDSETSLPIVVEKIKSPPAKPKTTKIKELKEPKEPKTPKEQPPKNESKSQQQPQQQHRSPKKEKQTPPKLTSPLPPNLPEITITPIPAPSSSKKDKKKEKPVKESKKKKAAATTASVVAIEKIESPPPPPVVEKVKVKVKEEKPPKLSKAALKEEVPPREERPTRGKKDKDQEKDYTPSKKESKKEQKANKEKEKGPNQEAQVEVVTVGTILDADGNKIWICPACAKPDDGSPMIGCDQCDDWYHWECVGISVPPSAEEEWFCTRCTKLRNKPHKKHRK